MNILNRLVRDDISDILRDNDAIYYSLDYMRSNFEQRGFEHRKDITPLNEINKYKVIIDGEFIHKIDKYEYVPNMFEDSYIIYINTGTMYHQTVKGFDTITLYIKDDGYTPIYRAVILPELVGSGGKSLNLELSIITPRELPRGTTASLTWIAE